MSEYLDQETAKARDLLKHVLALAKANWPRTTDVTIETSGPGPHARVIVPAHVLESLFIPD